MGQVMTVGDYTEVAEAVGRRVLGWKGAEFLELIYLLEEKNTLELLRDFSSLSKSNQAQVIEFFRMAKAEEDCKLNVDGSGLVIEVKNRVLA
jgi:hypothetical protein